MSISIAKQITNMEQVQIEKVFHSLTQYAMGDIKHNIGKPIAAFILGTSLIDTLSRYKYRHSHGFIQFMSDYLPMYNAVEFENSFKKELIRFYSLSKGLYKIGWGDREKEWNKKESVIHVEDFVNHLDNALNAFLDDLREGRFSVQSIINIHPIIEDRTN